VALLEVLGRGMEVENLRDGGLDAARTVMGLEDLGGSLWLAIHGNLVV
jgi:hypothetical protein